ncbi:hypothetical protein GGX14DRAFT_408424 [Mycena pura]|uniref:Uncharacterized protein n=1 Tax=Mycena pura TaxID=153505 RepID=A0AAD6UMU9_9AGAR|nr:hypothetical protein GGX14DRAFT_408424 [Mycena pura]
MAASSGQDISVGAGHFRGTAPWRGRRHRLGGTSLLGRDILEDTAWRHCLGRTSVLGRDILGGQCLGRGGSFGDSASAGAVALWRRDISVGAGHFRGTSPRRHCGGGTSVLGRDIFGGQCLSSIVGGGTSVLGWDILGGHCMTASSVRDISVGAGHFKGTVPRRGRRHHRGQDISVGAGHFRGTAPRRAAAASWGWDISYTTIGLIEIYKKALNREGHGYGFRYKSVNPDPYLKNPNPNPRVHGLFTGCPK